MRQDPRKHVVIREERVPALGLGTWALEGSECVEAVVDALSIGYRHVDTAQAYGNEAEVGLGVRRSGIDRRDAWITTKVWWDHVDYEGCLSSARESLDRLDTGWIDLLLIHWPNEAHPLDEPLRAMRRLQEEGVVRYIGVSNFTPSLLERALELAPVFCNQVEYHPFLAQDSLLQVTREHDVLLTAYSPLARGRVTESETLKEIGGRHAKSAAQVALRWLVQQSNVAAVPRASDPGHRRENFEIFDFALSDEEMDRIGEMDEGLRLIDPAHAPDWEREPA